jgi:hypothetical protein
MNFSSILDISSFFIGMIINLILVSLMCYYFKRKYEILESAQTEQAKILYELLRRDSPKKVELFKNEDPQIDYTKDPLLKSCVIDSDSESDSDSDSEYEVENLPCSPRNTPFGTPPGSPSGTPGSPSGTQVFSVELSQEITMDELKTEDLIIEPIESLDLGEVETQTKEIVIDQIILDSPESNYNKMSIKQLKDILTSKGVKPKHNMKKDELVDLVKDIEQEVTI